MIDLKITEEDRKGTLFFGKPLHEYPQEDLLDIALYIAKCSFEERKRHKGMLDFSFEINSTMGKYNITPPPKPPAPPNFPIGYFFREGDCGPYCPKCRSSFKLKWYWWFPFWMFRTNKCIHQECENYYLGENNV